jgi:lipopolysaccharide transport system permease protein
MPITLHLLFLPLVIIVQFAFAMSIGIWLAAIAVFIRDVVQIMPTALTVIMFITPIFYAYETMPLIIQKISLVNPFYQISEGYRTIFIYNTLPNFYGLIYVILISIILFYFGLKAFRRAKGYFDSAI